MSQYKKLTEEAEVKKSTTQSSGVFPPHLLLSYTLVDVIFTHFYGYLPTDSFYVMITQNLMI